MEKPSFESLGNEPVGVGNKAVEDVKNKSKCNFCDLLEKTRGVFEKKFKQNI
jgi:hypothetical protein